MLNCRTDPFRFQTLSAGSFSGWYSFSILPFSSSGISIIISVTSHVYGFACSPQSHPGNVKGSGISVMVARTVVKDFSGVGDFAWVAHATRMQKAAERIVLIWSNVASHRTVEDALGAAFTGTVDSACSASCLAKIPSDSRTLSTMARACRLMTFFPCAVHAKAYVLPLLSA